MAGAFPTETAISKKIPLYELKNFGVDEKTIDAAEGSIAIASYSMPQLIYGVSVTQGFSIGGLTNEDLSKAYRVLSLDTNLIKRGVIPEPTGIMGLAAGIKRKESFTTDDTLLLCFTGHGSKDLNGIKRLVPELSEKFTSICVNKRSDLGQSYRKAKDALFIEKNIDMQDFIKFLDKKLYGDVAI